ncbi:acyl-CoA synthetase [Burkholderia plantarii]|uniref:acyl-CoA synthetase n=1 Tax=Burkholderia plantarii TaxID=41899 RepID=UPI0006D8D02D|nr:acyl-CoA synthetase [Burkholderia plantarii]ALK33649.1 acyl-CoA synthetase [Burkholderia plantarii]WLE62679.1 acyl-CoA synthetase [Burkholderia plantarii]GLZ16816.1 acyl-CoA synthetase [Burkholderia plantarii]
MTQLFETGLGRREANHVALTPIDFIARAAEVYGSRLAVVHGAQRTTWSEAYERARRLAGALAEAGIGRGDTVAAVLPNIPPMIDAHFGVPMAGAVLNAINTRLDVASILFMLRHGEARLLIVDTEYAELARRVAQELPAVRIVCVADALPADPASFGGATDYEAFLAGGDPNYAWTPPADEWDAIALNYTSGTTGEPKGVVYHHRGAYLAALSNLLEWDMPKHAVYLWTLPMFHCNGWCFPWAVAARAGVNVCLRKFDPRTVFELIRRERVTHYSGAPIVHGALADAPAEWRAGIEHVVHAQVAGAAPAPAVIAKMKAIGFELLHVYGLTEIYGPATVCAEQQHWATLPDEEVARMKARQGVRYHLQAGATVLDPDTMQSVPADGETLGEIMFRGNLCMKGYLKNPKATDEAFAGGWFHTGDLGVLTPDGYIRIKDRRKDIIISGGENISSIEVEDALYRHPAVAVAAVVALPDPKWGEVPCAFVELREGMQASEAEILAHCRTLLAGYKMPKAVRFGELPKTSTGKIQKFQLRTQARAERESDEGARAGNAALAADRTG